MLLMIVEVCIEGESRQDCCIYIKVQLNLDINYQYTK